MVKTTSRPDQRNSSTMINKSTKSLNQQHKLVPTPNQITKQQSFQNREEQEKNEYLPTQTWYQRSDRSE